MDSVARAARVERRIKGLLDEKNGLEKELSKVEAELAELLAYLGRLIGGFSDERQEAYMDAMYGPLETGGERPPPRPSLATVRIFPSGDGPKQSEPALVPQRQNPVFSHPQR